MGKQRFCRWFLYTGDCKLGSACVLAHGEFDMGSSMDIKQTQACYRVTISSECPKRNRCRYAHTIEEVELARRTAARLGIAFEDTNFSSLPSFKDLDVGSVISRNKNTETFRVEGDFSFPQSDCQAVQKIPANTYSCSDEFPSGVTDVSMCQKVFNSRLEEDQQKYKTMKMEEARPNGMPCEPDFNFSVQSSGRVPTHKNRMNDAFFPNFHPRNSNSAHQQLTHTFTSNQTFNYPSSHDINSSDMLNQANQYNQSHFTHTSIHQPALSHQLLQQQPQERKKISTSPPPSKKNFPQSRILNSFAQSAFESLPNSFSGQQCLSSLQMSDAFNFQNQSRNKNNITIRHHNNNNNSNNISYSSHNHKHQNHKNNSNNNTLKMNDNDSLYSGDKHDVQGKKSVETMMLSSSLTSPLPTAATLLNKTRHPPVAMMQSRAPPHTNHFPKTVHSLAQQQQQISSNSGNSGTSENASVCKHMNFNNSHNNNSNNNIQQMRNSFNNSHVNNNITNKNISRDLFWNNHDNGKHINFNSNNQINGNYSNMMNNLSTSGTTANEMHSNQFHFGEHFPPVNQPHLRKHQQQQQYSHKQPTQRVPTQQFHHQQQPQQQQETLLSPPVLKDSPYSFIQSNQGHNNGNNDPMQNIHQHQTPTTTQATNTFPSCDGDDNIRYVINKNIQHNNRYLCFNSIDNNHILTNDNHNNYKNHNNNYNNNTNNRNKVLGCLLPASLFNRFLLTHPPSTFSSSTTATTNKESSLSHPTPASTSHAHSHHAHEQATVSHDHAENVDSLPVNTPDASPLKQKTRGEHFLSFLLEEGEVLDPSMAVQLLDLKSFKSSSLSCTSFSSSSSSSSSSGVAIERDEDSLSSSSSSSSSFSLSSSRVCRPSFSSSDPFHDGREKKTEEEALPTRRRDRDRHLQMDLPSLIITRANEQRHSSNPQKQLPSQQQQQNPPPQQQQQQQQQQCSFSTASPILPASAERKENGENDSDSYHTFFAKSNCDDPLRGGTWGVDVPETAIAFSSFSRASTRENEHTYFANANVTRHVVELTPTTRDKERSRLPLEVSRIEYRSHILLPTNYEDSRVITNHLRPQESFDEESYTKRFYFSSAADVLGPSSSFSR